jgi:hypothetical protein
MDVSGDLSMITTTALNVYRHGIVQELLGALTKAFLAAVALTLITLVLP